MNSAAGDPLIGKTIAQYEVVARLGGGGMGVVYAARDTKLGRRVALKFLPPQWSHDEAAKQRFIREAQAASATDHPNICTIHDIESAADGQLFIVMAHYDGITLKDRLESGPVTIDEAIDIAAQVAEGLAKAHAQGVVHRDIKPGNLMLTEDSVKILDFGLAKFAEARYKLTLEGSTIGTIAYMSPEQARGDEADARSDVWAIGVVLYEMLAGTPPFKGGYPEAIAHAIRHDAPPPLRAAGRAVPEALEQIVFRALHKTPAVRYQSARELARALRLLQGRTLPLDLRTEPLPSVRDDAVRQASTERRRWWKTRKTVAAAAAVAALLIGTPLWIFAPIERIPIAVAPVVNQTGYAELDPYRLALTQELIAALTDSRTVRVLPYERVLQIVRRFRDDGGDVSSRESLQALAMHAGVRTIVVPTLLYENGAWKARAEIRDAAAAINEAATETGPVVSSLMKEAVHGLIGTLGADVDAHFEQSGPRRARLAGLIRRVTGLAPSPAGLRARSLDAAGAFARGIDFYEQQEYAAAAQAFTEAEALDPRNPVPSAWRSHAARIMRLDEDAADAAARAVRLGSAGVAGPDRLFIDTVVAEAQGTDAAQRYQELAAAYPDDPAWTLELAAFQDRTAVTAAQTTTAINTYLSALRRDSRLPRADLELCRLYGPTRQNERVNARTHGERARAMYRALGHRNGEAHALLCLTEVLRVGTPEEREQARRNAEAALTLLQDAGATYTLPRAEYAVAMGAAAQGNIAEAAGLFARSLDSARKGGNRILEPLLLMNLGVAQARLGNPADAAGFYRESSRLYELLGDERRAAQQQANSAALQIDYGEAPAAALRDMQNALAVFEKLGDRNFEAFCRQVIAAYYRHAGRYREADLELGRAMAILRERNLEDDIASLTLDRAQLYIEMANYPAATTLLESIVRDGGPYSTPARIHLARARASAGDTAGAEAALAAASMEVDEGSELLSLLLLVTGEVAAEADRLNNAHAAFTRAAARWTAQLPDISSVEARAQAGFLDALRGHSAGRAAIESSLEQARRMERPSVEARCRLFLARLDIANRRFGEAIRVLDGIPSDESGRAIGPELRAHVQFWRGEALARLGRGDEAQRERNAARKVIDDLRAAMPDPDRARFAARPDIRRIIG